MTFKQYIESGKDTNTWPIFLKEMVTDTYMNFNLLYNEDRTNSMIRNLILGSKFDIAKQEELISKYEDIMKQENWGATQDSTSEGTSESNSIGKMFEKGISTEGEFSKDSSDNKGLATNKSTNRQVDNLNTFIALNATELNNLYRNVIGSFSILFQMIYTIGDSSSSSTPITQTTTWGDIIGNIADQEDLMEVFELVNDDIIYVDKELIATNTKFDKEIATTNTKITTEITKVNTKFDGEINTLKSGKQDKLLAGDNISITGTTISVTGSIPDTASLSLNNSYSGNQTYKGTVRFDGLTDFRKKVVKGIADASLNDEATPYGQLLGVRDALNTEVTNIKTSKQDKLIAGTNITINGNTISASGGGSPLNVLTIECGWGTGSALRLPAGYIGTDVLGVSFNEGFTVGTILNTGNSIIPYKLSGNKVDALTSTTYPNLKAYIKVIQKPVLRKEVKDE